MATPKFGIQIQLVDEEPRPVIGADMSTIGLIGPAANADADAFPLDTPVKVYSNDTAMTSKLGTAGYLSDAIEGINDQLADLEQAAQLVIVRTAEGNDADPAIKTQKTIGKIMGSSVLGTGLFAFLRSADLLACTPRLICAPGYTGQMATSLSTLTLGVMGVGYLPGQSYPMTFSGGGDAQTVVQATGHAVANANGEIRQADLFIDTYGAWYSTPPTVTLPAPSAAVQATLTTHVADGACDQLILGVAGGGYVPNASYDIVFSGGGDDPELVLPTGHALADANGAILQSALIIDSGGEHVTEPPIATIAAPTAAVRATLTAAVIAGANPVCSMMPTILDQLLAHAIVEPAGTNEADDESWRETLNSKRLIAVTGGTKVMDPTSSEIVTRPLSARIAGVAVRRDFETGAPFHSWANQPVQGIVGPARAIGFSITDGANEGQQLLMNQIGILVRGETGSDFAIASGGFIFVGVDNLSDDPLWQMYNITRGRDYIHLSLLKVLRIYLGRFNITGNTIQAILNTMKYFLRDLQADEHILGSKCEFKGVDNSAEEIRLGHISIAFAAEEPPVLELIRVKSARYRPAVDAMVATLERQLSMAA